MKSLCFEFCVIVTGGQRQGHANKECEEMALHTPAILSIIHVDDH